MTNREAIAQMAWDLREACESEPGLCLSLVVAVKGEPVPLVEQFCGSPNDMAGMLPMVRASMAAAAYAILDTNLHEGKVTEGTRRAARQIMDEIFSPDEGGG